MRRPLVWLDRGTLNTLLTEHLRRVVGCQGATIVVGASRNVAPGESNWLEFLCLVPEHSDRLFVRAVARRRRVRGARALQRARQLSLSGA